MPKKSAKEHKSIYHITRQNLGLSREKASEMMPGFTADRLQRIENGRMQVQPQDVVAMADCYGSPELCNYFCSHECQIGRKTGVKAVEKKELIQIAVETLNTVNRLNKEKDRLLEIVEDGRINDNEYDDFLRIKDLLEKMRDSIEALELWAEQSLTPRQK